MTGPVRETLRDSVGPYGDTIEALKAYVLGRARVRAQEGWRLVSIEYAREYQESTSRWRYVAYPTYERGCGPEED